MRKMRILLIEDDKEHCEEYINFIKEQGRIHILQVAYGCKDGFSLLKKIQPDVILLDLEINNSDGNGIDFLIKLEKTDLQIKPYIIVITQTLSKLTHAMARQHGADFVYIKEKIDYSPKAVIDFATLFFEKNNQKLERNVNNDETIRASITTAIENVGITYDMNGRDYLIDAIDIAMKMNTSNLSRDVYPTIASKYKKSDQSIEKAIKNAINKAWRITDVQTIAKYYTPEASYFSGVPTNKELICYFAHKLRHE